MSVFIRLRKDKMGASKDHHKYYAHMVSTGESGTADLARLIQENTTFKQSEVRGIIDELVVQMKQLLGKGQTVSLDGFGRFHLAVESEGAENPEDFDIAHDIKRVKCKFLPAGTRQGQKTGPVTQLFGDGVNVKWFPGCEPPSRKDKH
jgi:predicted histone-like DNA-binding protein